MERRIAAIFAADMVGYSRLIELDEGDTLARQKRHRLELIDPAIERFHGHIVKLTGDGLIAEFGSVIEAVQCAIAIQNDMPVREEDQPEDRRIQYRIAINLGDVVFEDGDVYGDGVNIAARLEQLADPGGVVVSGTAYNLLKSNVDAEYVPLGEKRLKNIATPVRVYQVVDKGKAHSSLHRPLDLYLAVAAFSLVAIGLIAWNNWLSPGSRPEIAVTSPASETPSIVVLPLDNLSGDAAQNYFADGLTEDITTDLSQLSELFVISRNTAFTYAEQQVDPRAVSEELGVQYVLEGSVRRIGETLRINVQLVDGQTGGHLWAQRYDGSPDDVLTFQDRVIENVVSALPVHLEIGQIARADQGGTQNPKAFDAYLQGWDHYKRRTPEDRKIAVGFFERAVELDPSYGRAHAALAATYWDAWDQRVDSDFGFQPFESRRQVRRLAEESLEFALESGTGLAWQVMAEMHARDGNIDEMLAAANDAVRIDPNDPDGQFVLAQAETLYGRHANALKSIEHAMVLDPKFPAHYLSMKGIVLFNLGQFEEAAEFLDRALDRNPSLRHANTYRLAAYVRIERPYDDARRIFMKQGQTIDGVNVSWRYRVEEDWNTLADALRKADVP